jgi:hypothetical protein
MTAQRLRLISGVVSDLSIRSGNEKLIHNTNQRAAGVGVAAGLAAAGLAGAAAGSSIAATSAGDSVEFFTCKVDGEMVSGRFSKVTFKDGDELDMIQTNEWPNDLILAARRRADTSLWIAPHCSRGLRAHLEYAATSIPAYTFLFFLSINGFCVWRLFTSMDGDASFELFAALASLALTGVISLYYSVRFYFQWRPTARRAEAVFAALGYAEASRVDLERDHKQYCKAQGIKWPYPSDGPWIYHYPVPR